MNPYIKLPPKSILLVLWLLLLVGIKSEPAFTGKSTISETIFNLYSPINYQDTLFTVLEVHKIEGKIEQLETAQSFILTSIKSDSIKQTIVRAYSYNGRLLWEKNFDSEHTRIAVSEDSDVVVIKEPIAKDDPYDTSLRDCMHSVLDKSGKELSTFQNPCHSVFPMGNYGYMAINTEGVHANTSIYDFKRNKFIDYGEPVHNSTAIDTNRLVTFSGQQELQNPQALDSLKQAYDDRRREIYNRSNELRNLTNETNRDSINSVIKELRNEGRELRTEISEQIRIVSQWRIASLEMIELILRDREVITKSTPLKIASVELEFGRSFNTFQIAHEPVSEVIAFGASFLMQIDPVHRHERKIFFIDDEGSILNILNISDSIQQFEFIDESNVLVLIGTISKLPVDYSLLLYNFRENQLVWKKDNIPFGAYGFEVMLPDENSDNALIHAKITSEDPCKIDILRLNVESGVLSCPVLFDNHDILFHPLVNQNPSNSEEFVVLNSKKDRVIFGTTDH